MIILVLSQLDKQSLIGLCGVINTNINAADWCVVKCSAWYFNQSNYILSGSYRNWYLTYSGGGISQKIYRVDIQLPFLVHISELRSVSCVIWDLISLATSRSHHVHRPRTANHTWYGHQL